MGAFQQKGKKVSDKQAYNSSQHTAHAHLPSIRRVPHMQVAHTKKTKMKKGRAQWLTLVIPTLWETEAGKSLEVRSLRSAWPTW